MDVKENVISKKSTDTANEEKSLVSRSGGEAKSSVASTHISYSDVDSKHSSKAEIASANANPSKQSTSKCLQRSISANGNDSRNILSSYEAPFSSKIGGISDSGYLSHNPTEDLISQSTGNHYIRKESGPSINIDNSPTPDVNHSNSHQSNIVSPIGPLSEQTIQAMLKPLSYREDLSILSEDRTSNSLMSPSFELDGNNEQYEKNNYKIDSPSSDMSVANSSYQNNDHNLNNDIQLRSNNVRGAEYNYLSSHSAAITKGPPKSEVQLRYLLQIMMEANCLELASLISIVLKDALALIRIVNAARSCPTQPSSQIEEQQKLAVSRIYQNLKSLEVWAHSECIGYVPFFQTIQPQLNSLRSFLLQQSFKMNSPDTTNLKPSIKKPSTGFQINDKIASPVLHQDVSTTANSRKNSPATSLPPIYPTNANRAKKSSNESNKSSSMQSSGAGKPRLLLKKSLESVGEGRNITSGGNVVSSSQSKRLESASSEKEEKEENAFFATRSATLDQIEFEKARRNMLKNSVAKQREGTTNLQNNNTSSSVPNLNEYDNQVDLEAVEDTGNCVVS